MQNLLIHLTLALSAQTGGEPEAVTAQAEAARHLLTPPACPTAPLPAPTPSITAVLIDRGIALGGIDINASPYPVCSGDLYDMTNSDVGDLQFELLPPANPTDTYGPVLGWVDYDALGYTNTFYFGRWFNFDGTPGAVGQYGVVFAYPLYDPYPPFDPGDDIMRIRFEFKVPSGGLGGGPWDHIQIQ